MRRKLEQIILWKDRNIPGERVIPDHLKLAILSRGRIALPADRFDWILNIVRASGETWPDRLVRDLSEIFYDLSVTIELYRHQRPSLTDEEITEVFRHYLILNRARFHPDCILPFAWVPHTRKKWLEKTLDLDITDLFRKPRVRMEPKRPRGHVLLLYVCIPDGIRKFVVPERPVAPTPPASPMPPLEGLTSPSTSYNLRDQPGGAGNIIGTQVGHEVPVRVLDKRKVDGHIWFEIELVVDLNVTINGKAGKLTPPTRCWLVGRENEFGSGGLDYVAAPWDFFRVQLRDFETRNKNLPLEERITLLRQMSHDEGTPFDKVIGTSTGSLYLNQRKFVSRRWQLLKDYEAVRTPDGRVVDLHHIMVGLDVRRRREARASFLGSDIGTNWAAATWGGDLGAAATDMSLKKSTEWAKRHPKAAFGVRADYYFHTRGCDRDLIADVDVWGILALRSQSTSTIDDLLQSYYGHTIPGSVRPLTSARRAALEQFIDHYGFTYDSDVDYARWPVFPKQDMGRRRVRSEISRFARIWAKKDSILKDEPKENSQTVPAMALRFMWWLEYQVVENGAEVPP